MFPRSLPNLSAAQLGACVTVFYTALAVIGFVEAQLWSQVTYLNHIGWTVSNWHVPFDDLPSQLQDAIELRHPAHRLRYFLTAPLFWLSDVTQISANAFFTACVPIVAGLSVWSAARAIMHQSQATTIGWVGIVALLPLMGIFLATDGRLFLAFGGAALILGLHLGPGVSIMVRLAGTAVALWLCGVTSGTLYATFAALLVITGYVILTTLGRLQKVEACLPVLFVLLLFNYDLAGALSKNVAYFGGGLKGALGMLGHGFGSVFLKLGASPVNLVMLGVGAVVFLGVLAVLLLRVPEKFRMLILLVFVAIGMGAFGYSTLALALIPTCILMGCVFIEIEAWARPNTA